MPYGLDYVFAGAEVIFSANVPGTGVYDQYGGQPWGWTDPTTQAWFAKWSSVLAGAAGVGSVVEHSESATAGQLAFKLRSNIDRRSINDVKADMDGLVRSAGFQVLASQVYFTYNPRRDEVQQPPVNTPGVDPRVTQKPPQNLTDNYHANDTFLGNVGQWWGQAVGEIGDGLSSAFGINIDGKLVMIAGGALVLLLIARNR